MASWWLASEPMITDGGDDRGIACGGRGQPCGLQDEGAGGFFEKLPGSEGGQAGGSLQKVPTSSDGHRMQIELL
jgi:hypothetical protein